MKISRIDGASLCGYRKGEAPTVSLSSSPRNIDVHHNFIAADFFPAFYESRTRRRVRLSWYLKNIYMRTIIESNEIGIVKAEFLFSWNFMSSRAFEQATPVDVIRRGV